MKLGFEKCVMEGQNTVVLFYLLVMDTTKAVSQSITWE
jgi:hypothetical protein